MLVVTPYMLGKSGLLNFRFEAGLIEHFKILANIIKTALESDEIMSGIRQIAEQFICNITSSGAWIKFTAYIIFYVLIVTKLPELKKLQKLINKPNMFTQGG